MTDMVYDNGVLRPETAQEKAERAKVEAELRHRPLSAEEVLDMTIRQTVQTLSVDDATAHRMMEFYPDWQSKAKYTKGNRVRYNGDLWRCLQGHTSIETQTPGPGMEAIWTLCEEEYTGDEFDPIPYRRNNELVEGLCYTEDGKLYRCIRASGQPVYEPLSKLATEQYGKFVEKFN